MNLKEKVKRLPCCPGVYIMKDSLGTIIYIGKSKNLKNRVGSYFQNLKYRSSKIVKLIKNLKDFEYVTTDTEFEAFMLECKLIKNIKPSYNKQMKNPESYCYIKVKISTEFSGIEISSNVTKGDRNIYFGPYKNINKVKNGIQYIREYYKILCNNNPQRHLSCLNYSLGLCIGMCLNNKLHKQYIYILNKIINLLNGDDNTIFEEIRFKMNNASEKLDFENAAKYRDYLDGINYLVHNISIIKFAGHQKNIVLLEYLDNTKIKFFIIKGNKLLYKKKYIITDDSTEKIKYLLKANILFYFKKSDFTNSMEIEKYEIDEFQIIYNYIKSKSNNCKYIIIPQKYLDSLDSTSIDSKINELFQHKSR